MLEFCPSCFSRKELAILKGLKKIYRCTKCQCEWPRHYTMVSEQAVRLYCKDNPNMLSKLKKVIRNEN